MTAEGKRKPHFKYRPSRRSVAALCQAAHGQGPTKPVFRFRDFVSSRLDAATLRMSFVVSAMFCLAACGDGPGMEPTLTGWRTSPSGKYVVQDWACCADSPGNSFIRLKANAPDQKVTVLANNVSSAPIFVWDDETHLTIRTNREWPPPFPKIVNVWAGGSDPRVVAGDGRVFHVGDNVGNGWRLDAIGDDFLDFSGNDVRSVRAPFPLLKPDEPLEGVHSALGVTIAYPPSRTNDFKDALRIGHATSEYQLAASDITASVSANDFRRTVFGTREAECQIAFEASPAGRFEKIGLLLQAWHNSERKTPEPKGIMIDAAKFSIGKLANGSYRKTALTYAFFEDFPLSQQHWGVIGDEQSIFEATYPDLPDLDQSMEKQWPIRLAADALRFRYIFDFDGESISYVMPLADVRQQVEQFVKCVESR